MDWDLLVLAAYVAVGGAIGAVLRFAAGCLLESTDFPWSTFLVNLVGCTLVALIAFSVGGAMTRSAAVFLFVGIFGAFTTMSTFTLETVALFEDGRTVRAFGNAVLNGGGCLAGAFAGRFLALLI